MCLLYKSTTVYIIFTVLEECEQVIILYCIVTITIYVTSLTCLISDNQNTMTVIYK